LLKRGAVEKGIFYLKPSMALGLGNPRFDGERFLDDVSIKAYKVADSGKSFTFFAIDESIPELRALGFTLKTHQKYSEDISVLELVWVESQHVNDDMLNFDTSLPRLLLDSEVIYSNTYQEAINNIVRQQERSATALIFGGPGSLTDPLFKSYVDRTIGLLKGEKNIRFSVLSYLPVNEPISSYTWLELCRNLQIEFPQRFAFSAFAIPRGQLRPFSYHVYDGNVVHIGLRTYSPQRGTPTLSSAIMLKNKRIASRFEADFIENFRSAGLVDDIKYSRLLKSFGAISPQDRSQTMRTIREMIANGIA
jgi:hypothetical protein